MHLLIVQISNVIYLYQWIVFTKENIKLILLFNATKEWMIILTKQNAIQLCVIECITEIISSNIKLKCHFNSIEMHIHLS